MTDDFLSRAYADNHQHLSDGIAAAIGSALTAMRIGFDRLNAYQFDAPWKHIPHPR